MSIIEQQKELEYYPDDVLAQEMMQPTGIAPSFLVATEIKRRNDMRNAYQSQMNPQPQTSVVEEEAMELGGIPNVDPNAMQQQMMQQPMPQQQMPQQMPQGAPMQMKEGGAIRYQSGQYIDPNLIAMGLTLDDEGKIVPIDESGTGPLGGIGSGGWALDFDPFAEFFQKGFGEGRGAKATGEVLLAGGKAAAGKGLWNIGRKKLAGSAGKIKDKFKGGIESLRSRLGGTKYEQYAPYTKVPIPPASVGGKAVDVVLNAPKTTAAIAGGAGLSTVPTIIDSIGTEVEATDVEAKEVSLTLEEKAELSGLLNDASINLTNIGFGQGGYSSFKKGSQRDQLNFLRAAKARGDMPEQSIINTPNNVETNAATSRSNVMDQINSILEGGGQSLRDQQGAALVQLGAGIAAGDLAGGLSAAGKEVSALKAARSAEKLKALAVMVDLNYKEGLIGLNEAENILNQIEILGERIGDPKAEEKIARLEQKLAQLGGGIGTGIPSLPYDYGT